MRDPLLWHSFPGVEGGLDAAVDVPSASVDMPSGSVEVPSVDLSGKTPDMPSVGGEISGDLPSGDVKLTGPDVDVEGGGVSLAAGLAAGVTAAVGAAAVGLGLSDKADKPDVEVRIILFSSHRHRRTIVRILMCLEIGTPQCCSYVFLAK